MSVSVMCIVSHFVIETIKKGFQSFAPRVLVSLLVVRLQKYLKNSLKALVLGAHTGLSCWCYWSLQKEEKNAIYFLAYKVIFLVIHLRLWAGSLLLTFAFSLPATCQLLLVYTRWARSACGDGCMNPLLNAPLAPLHTPSHDMYTWQNRGQLPARESRTVTYIIFSSKNFVSCTLVIEIEEVDLDVCLVHE